MNAKAIVFYLQSSALIVGMASVIGLAGPRSVEPVGLELIEERTESFANALLDLSVSVRDGEIAKIGRHFAPHPTHSWSSYQGVDDTHRRVYRGQPSTSWYQEDFSPGMLPVPPILRPGIPTT